RDQRRLLHPHRLPGHRDVPVPHPRALRHGRPAGARHVARRGLRRRGMSPGFGSLALAGLLAVPAGGAIILATIPRYRVSAALNVAVCALTLASAAALYAHRPEPSLYLLVDDVNTVFLLVGGLVGFTTSLFSAGYIAHERSEERRVGKECRCRGSTAQ